MDRNLISATKTERALTNQHPNEVICLPDIWKAVDMVAENSHGNLHVRNRIITEHFHHI